MITLSITKPSKQAFKRVLELTCNHFSAGLVYTGVQLQKVFVCSVNKFNDLFVYMQESHVVF